MDNYSNVNEPEWAPPVYVKTLEDLLKITPGPGTICMGIIEEPRGTEPYLWYENQWTQTVTLPRRCPYCKREY